MSPAYRHRRTAFTQTDTLIFISVVGILTSIGMNIYSSATESVRREKLVNDVYRLNDAISIYLANGGNHEELTEATEVLRKLKQRRDPAKAVSFVGVGKDAVIDARISIQSFYSADQAHGAIRAYWDRESCLFKLTTKPVAGVASFWIDPELAEQDFGVDVTRQDSVVSYASESTWIWDYKDRQPDPPEGASVVVLGTPKFTTPGGPSDPPYPSEPPGGTSGGLALNLGSGTAKATDGIAINLLSDEVSADSGELAIGIAGIGLLLGGDSQKGSDPMAAFAWADPPAETNQGSGFPLNLGSGTSAATNGVAANMGSGATSAVHAVSANLGSGSSTATHGISGNVGEGTSSATNGIGLNVGSGSAIAGGGN